MIADRSEVSVPSQIETQQHKIAFALNAYTDSCYKKRNRFASIMAFLPRLRRLNALCTHAFSQVQVRTRNVDFCKFIKSLIVLCILQDKAGII